MKSHRIACVFTALCLSMSPLFSQNYNDPDWDEVLELLLSDDEMSSPAFEEYVEMYEQMRSTPLNINTATVEELERLQFLSPKQIEDIHAYIYMHGPMMTLGELMLTGSLDWNTRRILRHFVYAGDIPPKRPGIKPEEVFRYGRNELTGRMDIPLYKRDGFKEYSAEELERYPNREYLGGRLSNSVRYSFNWRGRLRFGFTADRDSGEPFSIKDRAGFDFWSPYFYISDAGRLKTLAAGNFKASFGRGLLMNSGFSLGKAAAVTSINRTASGLKPHSSLSETGYFQGIGGSVSVGKTVFTLLGAYTPADAIIKGDSLITSFKTDGYHRTGLELSRRHNIRITSAAFNANYRYNGISLGTTLLYERFPYSTKTVPGGEYAGVSADWSVRRAAFGCSGEISCSNGGMALLNELSLRLSQRCGMMLLLRHYSPSYYSMRCNALAESDVRNETGLLIGFSRSGKIRSEGYVDLFRHPEARYGAGAPSNGIDIRLLSEWNPDERNNLYATARFKSKQKDCKPSGTLEYCITWRCRLRWTHMFNQSLSCRTQLFWSRYDFLYEEISDGVGMELSAEWRPCERLSCSAIAVRFLTESYESNISVYEKGLKYAMGYTNLSGNGTRIAMTLRFKITDKLQFNMKAGSLIYYDRDEIGSSRQRIESSHKEDINLQLTWNF